MKNLITAFCLVIAILALGVPAGAQITINANDLSGVGTTWTVGDAGILDPVQFDVGSAGGGQTWNFSAYEWESAAQFTVMNPSGAPHNDAFPTATRVEHGAAPDDPEGGLYTFERIQSDAFIVLGMVQGDDVTAFLNEAVTVALPVTYETQWTTLIEMENEPAPGMVVFVHDYAEAFVDAWGTVNTPYGSHACLRIQEHHWFETYLNGELMFAYEALRYVWLNQQGQQVVVVQSQENVTDPNFDVGLIDVAGAPLAAEPLRGPMAGSFAVSQNYPNPFNPTTSLPLSLEKNARVSVKIFDTTGRLVSSEDFELNAGEHALPVNGANWATGTYFAHVSTSEQSQTVKMHLIK